VQASDQEVKRKILLLALALFTLLGLGLTALPQVAEATYAFANGTGTALDPYQIADEADLRGLAADVNDPLIPLNYDGVYFLVTADIALTGTWEPIGLDTAKTFRGNFDGGGHVISDLLINDAYEGNVGLFGFAGKTGSQTTTIQNVIVKGTIASTSKWDVDAYAGGLLGKGEGVLVDYCIAEVGINIEVLGEATVGGLIGETNGGRVFDSAATGSVPVNIHATADMTPVVGGLLGKVGVPSGPATMVIGCFAGKAYPFASQSVISATGPNAVVGGLIGIADGIEVMKVYTTNRVENRGYADNGRFPYTGGLIGVNNHYFSDGYTTSVVDSDPNSIWGALVGQNNSSIKFSEFYYNGAVTPAYGSNPPGVIPSLVAVDLVAINPVTDMLGTGTPGPYFMPTFAGGGLDYLKNWKYAYADTYGYYMPQIATLTEGLANTYMVAASRLSVMVPIVAVQQLYPLAVVADTGGSITPPDPSGNYDVGDIVTISATPAVGYRFIGWTATGSYAVNIAGASSAVTTFLMPDEGVTLTAHFAKIILPDSGDGDSTPATPANPSPTPTDDPVPAPPTEDVNNPDTPLGAPTPGEPDPEPNPEPNPHTGAAVDGRLLLLPVLLLVILVLSINPEKGRVK
jgi:uncharacterized repeat protein (TIGR02543 family)